MDLDEEALIKILVEPKNALVKQYAKLFDMEDVELEFTDDALRCVAIKAIERKTGARGLRSILEGILLDTMFDLPSMDGVDEVHIDKDVVDGHQGTGSRLCGQGQDRRRGLAFPAFSLDQCPRTAATSCELKRSIRCASRP